MLIKTRVQSRLEFHMRLTERFFNQNSRWIFFFYQNSRWNHLKALYQEEWKSKLIIQINLFTGANKQMMNYLKIQTKP